LEADRGAVVVVPVWYQSTGQGARRVRSPMPQKGMSLIGPGSAYAVGEGRQPWPHGHGGEPIAGNTRPMGSGRSWSPSKVAKPKPSHS